jgi:hypothetical protein
MANPSQLQDLIPRDWVGARDIHLGDDGVLRRMEIQLPTIARRDDHLRAAQWEVRDAVPLSGPQIRRWLDHVGSSYSELSRRHFEEVYEGIDGRDVDPDEHLDPHPSLLLRSPGSVMEVREFERRDPAPEEGLLMKRRSCSKGNPCPGGQTCHYTDAHREGTCSGGGTGGTVAPPGSPARHHRYA